MENESKVAGWRKMGIGMAAITALSVTIDIGRCGAIRFRPHRF